MNYYFTGMLVILFVVLCFVKPAYPRNEYLNDGTNTCSTGSFDVSVEQRDSDYNHRSYSPSNDYDNFNDDRSIRLTYRKYLGTDCKTSKENVAIKQQLELMKMCGRVNSNPSLALNKNFNLLVSKCRGVSPTNSNNRPDNSQSYWDEIKDGYKKENPDIKLMGDKKILKMPPKDFILPLPKPKQ